jgi:hypothetical protein
MSINASSVASFFLSCSLCALAAGCGSGYKYSPVSGRVTIDGKPVANLRISFQPTGSSRDLKPKDPAASEQDPNYNLTPGPGSAAKTDAEGRYTLRVVGEDGEGAVMGRHRVRISQNSGGEDELHPGGGGGGGLAELLPPKYNSETELTFEVKPGPNEANFELKSK